MGFKSDEFIQADFKPREHSVSVPDLKSFFDEDEDPVWVVRGLTGHEVARYQEAVTTNRDMAAIAEGLASPDNKKVVEAIREKLGIGDAVPDDIAKRIEVLVLGSVDPVVDNHLAVKLCERFPVPFYELTTKILGLTGEGYSLGKSSGSGETKK